MTRAAVLSVLRPPLLMEVNTETTAVTWSAGPSIDQKWTDVALNVWCKQEVQRIHGYNLICLASTNIPTGKWLCVLHSPKLDQTHDHATHNVSNFKWLLHVIDRITSVDCETSRMMYLCRLPNVYFLATCASQLLTQVMIWDAIPGVEGSQHICLDSWIKFPAMVSVKSSCPLTHESPTRLKVCLSLAFTEPNPIHVKSTCMWLKQTQLLHTNPNTASLIHSQSIMSSLHWQHGNWESTTPNVDTTLSSRTLKNICSMYG